MYTTYNLNQWLKAGDQATILAAHNAYRSAIALGKDPYFRYFCILNNINATWKLDMYEIHDEWLTKVFKKGN
jgi:hypothetical protein